MPGTPTGRSTPSPDTLEGEHLALEAARLALDMKAEDPVVLDVRRHTSYADYFVLLTARSDRQVRAVADAVADGLKAAGRRPMGSEGRERASWVLLDYSDVVVHVFHEPARELYDLDGLWADVPRVPVPGAPPRRGF